MDKWYIENHLGFNVPFLLNSINNPEKPHPIDIYKYKCKILEKECAKVTILSISSSYKKIVVKGFIENDGIIIQIDLADTNSIILFSCYDELHLFFFSTITLNNKEIKKVFTTSIFPCGNWGIKEIVAQELQIIQPTTNPLEQIIIKINIENLRYNEFHYLNSTIINQNRTIKVINTVFNKYICKIPQYNCIFCFTNFSTLHILLNHINYQHLFYCAYYKDNNLIICPNKNSCDINKEFCFIHSRYKGRNAQIIKNKNYLLTHKLKHIVIDTIEHNDKKYDILLFSTYLIKIRQYKFDYALLIEKEYAKINTNTILSKHINSRFNQTYIIRDHKDLMEYWNFLKIQSYKTKDILMMILNRFGLIQPVLELVEILFTQGVLTSVDIMNIFNEYTTKKNTLISDI